MSHSIYPTTLEAIDKTQKLSKGWKGYTMYRGGILGFENPSQDLTDSLTIQIKMRGTTDGVNYPHYQLFLNTGLVGSGFVTENDSVYSFRLKNNFSDTTLHLIINFDNDKMSSIGDRNLFISDIQVNFKSIDSLTVRDYFVQAMPDKNVNLISNVRHIKYYLGDVGFDTSRVKIVEVDYDSFNKTLALAKGAKYYFSNTQIQSLNIITAARHSNRSYLNFKNCLEDHVEVGCIPIKSDLPILPTLYDKADERVSLLLTWVYWWFH